jgi:predicted HicB family RNase H-like nuclease
MPHPPQILLAVRIPKGLHRRLKVHVAQQGTSMARFVAAAITAHLKHRRRA